ncbi:unnamed protein product [Chilo suppressalis]|uniref:Ig-like domain-containing protein n=1 Tax=Chilo suppressalis TaxID=168631 RepID=A0ABN8B581_CHISP|nr:unnamed protein product [Chilo suppressalis]
MSITMYVHTMIYISVICAFCIFGQVLAEVNMTITVLDNNRDKTTKTFMCSNDSNTVHVQVFDTIYFNLISKLYMNYFWCYIGEGRIEVQGNDHKNVTSVLFQVTDTSTGQLNCWIYTERDVKYIEDRSVNYLGHTYRQLTCQMTLYVKHKLSLTIFNAKDNIKEELFKNGVYHYKAGDHLTITCSCLSLKSSNLPKGATLTIFQLRDKLTQQDKSTDLNNVSASFTLQRTDNYSSIICSYRSPDYRSHDITLDLVLVPDEPPKMTLEGGDGKFYETSDSNYVYEGTTTDIITISCSRKQTEGSLHWDYCSYKTDANCSTVRNTQSLTIKRYNFSLSKMNGSYLECVYTSPEGVPTKSTISFKLTKENDQNEVSGDRNSFKIDVASNFFYNGDTFYFNCSTKGDYMLSMYFCDSSDVHYTVPENFQYNNGLTTSSNSYNMNFSSDEVTLYCQRLKKNLVRRSSGIISLKLTRQEITDEKGPKSTNEKTTNSLKEDQKPISDNMNSMFNKTSDQDSDVSIRVIIIYSLAGVGILFILILLIVIIKILTSKKVNSRRQNQEDVTYENLQNESASPMPFPRAARLEEIYLTPSDSSAESPYAYPTNESETYALPYTAKNIEELYSKPVPKSQRDKPSNQKQLYSAVLPKNMRNRPVHKTDDVTYAQIEINTKKSLSKPDRNPNSDYATIMDVNVDYANLNISANTNVGTDNEQSYTNVFNKESYVNSKSKKVDSDYAEPSYCEINKL